MARLSGFRVVEETHELLRQYVSREWKLALFNMERANRVLSMRVYPMIERYLEYIDKRAPNPMVAKAPRSGAAALLFLFQWVDRDSIEDRGLVEGLQALEGGSLPGLKGLFKRAGEYVYRRLEGAKLLDILDSRAGLYNGLSQMIIDATVHHYLRRSSEGNRIAVSAGLGAGKTTLSFYAGVAALRTLGLPEEEAVEIAGKLITNDFRYAVEILEATADYAYKGVFIPMLVIDDVAALISKYWIWGSDRDRKWAIALIKALKISREGVGLVLLPTDKLEALPRGIRESVDLEARGEKIRRYGLTYSLWRIYDVVLKKRNPYVPPWMRGMTGDYLEKVPGIYIGSVHPPMWAPDEVYLALRKEKMRRRSEILHKTLAEGGIEGD